LLKRLPRSLCTILSSKRFIKIGHNITADLKKLSRDFPEFVYPFENTKRGRKTVIELGILDKAKNAVSNGNASLATIVAATLHENLSKETCDTEWSAPTLTESQIEYAALDALVNLRAWDVLKDSPTYVWKTTAVSITCWTSN
jgi:ribonuclease D